MPSASLEPQGWWPLTAYTRQNLFMWAFVWLTLNLVPLFRAYPSFGFPKDVIYYRQLFNNVWDGLHPQEELRLDVEGLCFNAALLTVILLGIGVYGQSRSVRPLRWPQISLSSLVACTLLTGGFLFLFIRQSKDPQLESGMGWPWPVLYGYTSATPWSTLRIEKLDLLGDACVLILALAVLTFLMERILLPRRR